MPATDVPDRRGRSKSTAASAFKSTPVARLKPSTTDWPFSTSSLTGDNATAAPNHRSAPATSLRR